MKYLSAYLVKTTVVLIVTSVLFSCTDEPKTDKSLQTKTAVEKGVPVLPHTVIKKYPHDTTAFTEGFLFHEGKLYESTGSTEYYPYGKSSIGILDLEKGKLELKAELDKKVYFGEGIVILNNKIYQLTYTTQIGFVYDLKTFKQIGRFNYSNKEGWGLTTNGKELIMSDGTFNLTFMDPETFKVTKTLAVTENGFAQDNLNELEYVNGFIYANIWMNNSVVKIDPESGKILAKLNLNPLLEEARTTHRSSLEMNGIAYDSITKRFLVTGKFWPTVYEIKFDL